VLDRRKIAFIWSINFSKVLIFTSCGVAGGAADDDDDDGDCDCDGDDDDDDDDDEDDDDDDAGVRWVTADWVFSR
jgi:hypothetical protein